VGRDDKVGLKFVYCSDKLFFDRLLGQPGRQLLARGFIIALVQPTPDLGYLGADKIVAVDKRFFKPARREVNDVYILDGTAG